MTQALACDGPGCDTWSKDEAEMETQWLTLFLGNVKICHFCCGWCMTKWGAEHFAPTEVVE